MMSATGFCGHIVGDCDVRLWSMTGTERAQRVLTKAGVSAIVDEEAAAAAQCCLMIRADWVIDQALIGLLKEKPGSVLVVQKGGSTVVLAAFVSGALVHGVAHAIVNAAALPAGLELIAFDPAQPLYLRTLRKKLKPVALPLTQATVRAAEKATFAGSYKGVTDVVTKYWWPLPARIVVRWCAGLGISPNMVTLAGFVLVLLAPWWFVKGWFWAGLLAAWVMTFLDTVDGKLARCTLTYSRFGDVFDHGIDLISPPFWWLAWHAGALAVGAAYPWSGLSLAVIFGGYIVLRLQEGLFIALFGMHIHVWRRFDSFFRLIVARRNPILIILTVAMLFGAPGWAMVLTAAWTAVSILIHAVQILQALWARRKGALVSWMAA